MNSQGELVIVNLIIFGISIAFDILIGEYPNKIHPTVWFGKIIGFFDNIYKRKNNKIDFVAGVFSALVVILFALILSFIPKYLPYYLSLILQIYFLKSTFSIRSLGEHIKNTIKEDIEEQRTYVQRVVSRDVKNLDRVHLNSAAIESLAENINDAIVAPIFYFLIFGLLGALIYRAINTMDAMVGYKKPRYLYFGKFAARCDDVLNFIPSRITVLLFIPLNPKKVINYWRMARYKINGDKPIAAMSAVLGVMLEKKGVYKFKGRNPNLHDIEKAIKISYIVTAEWVIIASLVMWVIG